MQFFKKNYLGKIELPINIVMFKRNINRFQFRGASVKLNEKFDSGIVSGKGFSISFDYYSDEGNTVLDCNAACNIAFNAPVRLLKDFEKEINSII